MKEKIDCFDGEGYLNDAVSAIVGSKGSNVDFEEEGVKEIAKNLGQANNVGASCEEKHNSIKDSDNG